MPPIIEHKDQNDLRNTADFELGHWPFEKFNPVQSRVLELYNKDANCLIAAATSSGKTLAAEIYLAHEIRERGGKGMYLGPLKALTQEKIDDWSDEKHHFSDLNISICTGDYRLTADRRKELANADLIVMTTEMLNARCRNFKSENNDWMRKIGTIIVDECVSPGSLVDTDKGLISIGRIIDENLDVKVASFNHRDNKIEYSKIVARTKKLLKRKWFALYYKGGDITVTKNHLVFCENRGYVHACDVKIGDIIYVQTKKCRGAGNIGDVVGGREFGEESTWKVGTFKDSTVEQAKGVSRVEIQKVKEIGWHPAKDCTKWRIWKRNLQIQYSQLLISFKNLRYLLFREKTSNKEVVGFNQRSDSFVGVVYGRRQPRKKPNVYSHRGVFRKRSKFIGELVGGKMGSAPKSLPSKKLLGTEIPGRGERQVPEFNKRSYYTQHELQDNCADGDVALLYVRSAVSSRPASNPCCQSHVMQKEILSKEVESYVRKNESLDGQESYCCDLEIDGNNNYFVDGVLVHNSHLLTVEGRGHHLEAGLMKFSQLNPDARIIMLSATMPNVKQIAEWVSYELTGRETHMIVSKFRPCPLIIHYERYWDGSRSYQENENQKIFSALQIVQDYPDDKFLVFVHTKRTGEEMKRQLNRNGFKAEFHNADLDKEKRIKLESDFRTGDLRVIVATSTLAWGCYKYGSKALMHDARLKKVELLKPGDELLSPDGETYRPVKVIKAEEKQFDSGFYVKLERGDEMSVSSDHIFLAAEGRNSPGWVDVRKLSKGDFIGVPSDIKFWDEKPEFDDYWYLLGFSFGDGCLCDLGKHADGSQKALLDICLGERGQLSEIVVNIFQKHFNYDVNIRDDTNGVPHLQTKKKSIVDKFLLHLPLGRKNGQDDVPKMDNASQISSFISGLFDADGGTCSHSNGNTSVEISNISRDVIESVRALLLCFGICSSIGKKKVKSTIINGRYQDACREYTYRIRIFGKDNLCKFQERIGFLSPIKRKILKDYIDSYDGYCKDFVPARSLIEDHLIANGLKKSDFRKITGSDAWNSVHIQDCRRDTMKKLISCTNVETKLNALFDSPIYWSRIESVKPCDGGSFMEIEVEHPHAYIGCGAISHNCNLPARRVIITGVHRGLSEVANYDIQQMGGRSGRVGLDTIGDAYILLPERDYDHWVERLKEPEPIISQMIDEEAKNQKVLAFHIVSEIHHRSIKTADDIYKWYKKSLGRFQARELDDDVVDNVIELLLKCGAIYDDNGTLKCSSIGMISSLFYFSPFDVSDLRKTFNGVFGSNNENNDLWVSMALGNTDTNRNGIVSKAERDEMAQYAGLIRDIFHGNVYEPAIKAGYIYFNLLNGRSSKAMAGIERNIRFDFPRISEVLLAIDSMSAKWGRQGYFKNLRMRVAYGVESHLVSLCRIPNIGKVRAEKLWKEGIKTPASIASNRGRVEAILELKPALIDDIVDGAAKLVVSEY